MSWDAYITNLLSSGNLSEGAIVGHDGVTWASSDGMKTITNEEITKLMNQTTRTTLMGTGLTIGGQKCTILRDQFDTDGTLQIRTKSTAEDPKTYSMTIFKANKCVVIGKGKDGVHGGTVSKDVCGIGDYLLSQKM